MTELKMIGRDDRNTVEMNRDVSRYSDEMNAKKAITIDMRDDSNVYERRWNINERLKE